MRLLVAVGVAALVTLGGTAAGAAPGDAPYRHFQSRPDLRPPRVKLFALDERRVLPGYIFIAPKKKVEQAGPLILDSRGRVVWFLPVDAKGVTDFRVQRYRGKPVLTWWHGRSADGKRRGRYSI